MKRIMKPALFVMAVPLVFTMTFGSEPTGAGSNEKDIAEITKKVFPSVVRVEVQNHIRRVATGVVVDKNGHIVTTALISPREEEITVTTAEGKELAAEFLGFDTQTQLALIRAEEKGLQPLDLGKSEDLAPGSWVCAVGISPERTASVTQGIVSSKTEESLRLNIWVTPGSSGGPIVDGAGRMVGLLRGVYIDETPVVFSFRDKEQVGSGVVVSRGEAPASGMAAAIPVDIVKFVSGEIREKGKVERGWLGVSIGQNEDGDVEIVDVVPDGPAAGAKIWVGDIVRKIDGKNVATPDVLAAEIRKKKPGQNITLSLERDGKSMEIRVQLGEYPQEEARKELELRFPRLFPPDPPGRPSFPDLPNRPLPPTAPRLFERFFEQRNYIGIYCDELNPELSEHFGVQEGVGLLVSKVTEGEPADKAGIRVGDVIVRVDGERVETIDDLIDLLQEKKKGDKVKVEFLRDKKRMTLEVEVAKEEEGRFFETDEFSDSRDYWQRYTDVFQNQTKEWRDEFFPKFQQYMKRINEGVIENSKEMTEEIQALLKRIIRKI